MDLNFNNFSNDQLDVVLCNNPDSLIKCDYQEKFSDHKPSETII